MGLKDDNQVDSGWSSGSPPPPQGMHQAEALYLSGVFVFTVAITAFLSAVIKMF